LISKNHHDTYRKTEQPVVKPQLQEEPERVPILIQRNRDGDQVVRQVQENNFDSRNNIGNIVVFTSVFSKLRASSDYYQRDRTRNLRSMLWKSLKKGCEMHSGYLESMAGYELKKTLSLDRFEIESKSKIKLKERVEV